MFVNIFSPLKNEIVFVLFNIINFYCCHGIPDNERGNPVEAVWCEVYRI